MFCISSALRSGLAAKCLSRLGDLWIGQMAFVGLFAFAASFCSGVRDVSASFSDNFNSGSDAGWTRYDPLHIATYSFPSGDSYRIQAGPSPAPNSFGASRAGSLREDVSFTKFAESVDLVAWATTLNSAPTNQSMGLLARVSSPGLGTTDGYALTYSDGGHDLVLSRITGEQPTLLARETVLPVVPEGGDYRLVFTGVGNQLTGQMFNASNLITPLATVSATDNTYGSGFSGNH